MLYISSKYSFVLIGLAVLLAQACMPSNGNGDKGAGGSSSSGSGGSSATGGSSAVGSSSATGGSSAVGSSSATGGSSAVGSSSATGGSSAVGSSSATGGSSAVGSSSATGGSSAVGSSSATGGSSAVGSSSAAGGSSASGGSSAAGGSLAAGGSSAVGGSSVVAGGVLITPDATGHVTAASNRLGIVGNWFSYVDTASTLSPPAGSFPNVGGKICTKGSLAASAGSYGGIGFELNDSAGQQPFNLTKNGVKGFSFVLSGTLPTGGVRFAYGKTKDDNVFFSTVTTIGQNTVLASVPPLGQGSWEKVETWDPTMIALIEIQVPGLATAANPFDFCVESLTALTQ